MTLCTQKTSAPYWNNIDFVPIGSSLSMWLTSDTGDSSIWIDRSGFMNNATSTTTIRNYMLTNGIFGSGFYFNGSSYMIVADNITLQQPGDWSLEATFRTTMTGVGVFAVRHYASGTRNYTLFIVNGKVGAGYHKTVSGYWVTSTKTFNDNLIHHYIATYNYTTGSITLYVDGNIEGYTVSGTPGQCKVVTGDMAIGNSTNSTITGDRYIGDIYDIKFYKKELNSIESLHNYMHSPAYYIKKMIIQ